MTTSCKLYPVYSKSRSFYGLWGETLVREVVQNQFLTPDSQQHLIAAADDSTPFSATLCDVFVADLHLHFLQSKSPIMCERGISPLPTFQQSQ